MAEHQIGEHAQRLAKVGDVIAEGEPIPANVTEVQNAGLRRHFRDGGDLWSMHGAGKDDMPQSSGHLSDTLGPLTVTAVREPEPAAEPQSRTLRVTMGLNIEQRDGRAVFSTFEGEIGSCERQAFLDAVAEEFDVVITEHPAEPDEDVVHYYVPEFSGPSGATLCGLGYDDDLSTTGEAGQATCGGCRAAADEDPAEPQPVDLLDLVVEYGAQIGGVASALECAGPEDVDRHQRAADALFVQIRDALTALTRQVDGVDDLHSLADRFQTERDEACENVARLNEIIDDLKARQPDPLVLSLPEVPEGAVALRGEGRWLPDGDGWRREDGTARRSFAEVMWVEHTHGSKSVTVEFASPREPRTWPLLDEAPDDLKAVRGASGIVYRRHPSGLDMFGESGVALALLQVIDGPLTEVLDGEEQR